MTTGIKKILGWREWVMSIPFFMVHIAAIIFACLTGFSWTALGWLAASHFIRGLFITVGFHRYLAHKAFRTSRIFQFILAFGGTTALQKGPLMWTSHHRDHHRYSDTDLDPHSPISGFFWSHCGWIFGNYPTNYNNVKDLSKYPELRFLDKMWLLPPLLFCVLLYLIGGPIALIWGGLVGTVFSWHATFAVNSICHKYGYRRFKTNDNSTNVWWLGLITLAESNQNSHHHHQASVNIGKHWSEIDPAYWLVKCLAKLRIVSNLNVWHEK